MIQGQLEDWHFENYRRLQIFGKLCLFLWYLTFRFWCFSCTGTQHLIQPQWFVYFNSMSWEGRFGSVWSHFIMINYANCSSSWGTETTHPALSWQESDRCKRQSNSCNLLQIKDGCKSVHGRPCGRASGRVQFSQSCVSLNGCSSIISLALNRKGIETSPCCEGQPLINRDKKWSWALKLMFLLSAFISALDFCSELNNGDVHIPEDPYLNCIQEVRRVEKGLFGISFVGRSATEMLKMWPRNRNMEHIVETLMLPWYLLYPGM